MPDKSMQKKPGRRYMTAEQRDQALLTLVLHGGSLTHAAQALDIPRAALHSIKRRHGDRYEELQKKHGHEIEERAVLGLQAFIVRAEEAKAAALDRTVQDMEMDRAAADAELRAIEEGDSDYKAPAPRIKSPDNALKNIAIAQGIGVQKILELTNRPTQIIQHNSLPETIARLRALGAVIEGTAETMVDSKQLPAGEPTDTDVVDAQVSDST